MGIVIDMHKHLTSGTENRPYFPWRQQWHVSMDWAYGALGGGRPPFDRDPQSLYPKQELRYSDPEGTWTIKSMDEGGVDVSVCLVIDYDYSWGSDSVIQPDEKNRHMSTMQEKYPGRIFGFAGVDPRRPGAPDIFEKAIKEHKLRGLKLIPKAGFYPWQEEVYRLLDIAQDYDVPVAICTQPSGGGYNRMRFADPIHVDDAIGDFPDIKFILLHAGAPLSHFFENALLAASRNPNVSLQLDFWIHGFIGTALIPSFISDEEAVVRRIAHARDVLGAHRIMWGTDTFSGPRTHGKNLFGSKSGFTLAEVVTWLRNLPDVARKYGIRFSADEVDLILGGNAARILGLDQPAEWQIPHKFGYRRRSPPPFRGGV